MAVGVEGGRAGLARPAARRNGDLLDSPHVYAVLVAGALTFLICFVGYPVVYNLVMSFQEVTIGNMARLDRPFIGLANYRDVLGDGAFGVVLRNTLVFTSVCVVMQVVLGFALALLFNERFPGASWFRGLILAGWILPLLVVGAVFKWMYATNGGAINEGLMALGLIREPIYWLSNPSLSLWSVIIANIWYGAPFAMILLAAGLAGLPGELYEAAHLDGAGAVQRFRHITLPLMMPTLLAVTVLCTIYTLRAFDLLWSMTGGGPINSSTTFPLWSYIFSFQQFKFGHGAAIATLMFLFVILAGLFYIRSLRTEIRL
jgi:multiple sugar transport system permease protein